MIIRDVSLNRQHGSARLGATVEWEESERAPLQLFIEVEGAWSAHATPNANALMLLCAIPAAESGEKRLRIDGAISPTLEDGLLTSMCILRRWYGWPATPLKIECQAREPRPPASGATTAQLLSGGLDSLCTLARNRRLYAREHPWSVTVGVLALGFDLEGFFKGSEADRTVDVATRALQRIAAEAGVELVRLRTNALDLDRAGALWVNKWHGAALSSLVHLLDSRIGRLLIASTYDAEHLGPWGSHPLLDGNYSSESLTVVHDALRLSRLEKACEIMDWPVAIENIRVCLVPADGTHLNCGRCEKCLRTMVALMVCGRLDQTGAFAARSVDADALRNVRILNGYTASCWRDLAPGLEAIGRRDLAAAVRGRLRHYQLSAGAFSPRGLAKWLDTNVLGRRISRRVSARRMSTG